MAASDLALPRSGRKPGRRQSRPRAAADRGRARLADPRVRRARVSGRSGASAARRCSGFPLVARRRRGRSGLRDAVRPSLRSGSPRSASAPRTREVLAGHFLAAEQRKVARDTASAWIEWLETLPGPRPGCLSAPRRGRARLRELGRERRAGLPPVLDAVVEAQLADPPPRACRRRLELLPDGRCSAGTPPVGQGGLVAALTATSPAAAGPSGRGRAAGGHDSPWIAIPAPMAATRRRRLDGRGHLRRRAPRRRTAGRAGAVRRRAGVQGFRARTRAPASGRALAGEGHGAVLLVARPEADPLPRSRARRRFAPPRRRERLRRSKSGSRASSAGWGGARPPRRGARARRPPARSRPEHARL